MPDKDVFHLKVPLDASSVKGFTPDRAVKVAAYSDNAPAAEQTIKFDNNGKATASFSFKQNPGSLILALGPDTVSAADLRHMQTVSATVPLSAWRDAKSITIPPIAISSYYWGEWWRWCRAYTVTGRVLCPDGSPVVGATVCAIDVHPWWWWISKEQVGCATTGTDGSFEIDFTRCCGWFPIWWWETREWLLDPYLVNRITEAFKASSKIQKLPRATPQPSLSVFEQLFAGAATAARPSRRSNFGVKGNLAATGSAIDPTLLEPVRAQLQELLPPDFPLPIWPWYPWAPWFDCSTNLIFQVTQNCGGSVNTIVNETVADTRWGIATDLNVTLTANSEACCAYSCVNQDCPEGNCLVPSDICGINVGSIGGNIGNTSTAAQVGLAYPGTQDRPFAGVVSLYGIFGQAANVDYYEFQYSTTGSAGPYTPLPLQAIDTITRNVLVVKPGPVFSWPPVGFPPNVLSDGTTNHNVIETIQHYEAVNGPQTWDAYTHDLLLLLNSANVLLNGTYYLQLVGWQLSGGILVNPRILPVCDPNVSDPPTNNYWVVNLDNQAPGDTDPTGQTCGLHICTDQPISDLLQVAIQHQDGSTTPVVGCGVVCIVDSDELIVDFAAYDPDHFLDSYNLQLLYGDDQSVPLLSVGTITASPIAPVWAPAPPAGLTGPQYADALAQGAVSPVWYGGSMRLTVSATTAFPTLPCAYLLQLNVYKRPIVNCDSDDLQQNVSFQSFTVQACPSAS